MNKPPKVNPDLRDHFPQQKRRSSKKRRASVLVNSSIQSPHQPSGSPDYHYLSKWGLPHQLTRWYRSKGITQLFDWQAECLCTGNVLEGENMVYSAPTSAGKTMVAEIIMYKQVIEKKKKALMIMPFVSITREKMLSLKQALKRVGISVDAFAGSVNPRGGLSRVDVAVCTIEKANSMINRLIEEGNLKNVGIIVVDELHMIGDSSRGYILELLLTKVLYLNDTFGYDIQIIGMSATLPNLPDIAKWLKAQLYITDFRPVPLLERVLIGEVIYDVKTMLEVSRLKFRDLEISSEEKSTFLAIETIVEGHGCLIFCQTKAICEKLAKDIATDVFKLGNKRDHISSRAIEVAEKLRDICRVNFGKIVEVLEQLRRSSAGLDKILEKTVKFGVAFHHAGLTIEERNIIENAFREGTLKVLCATSTLSAGVNLPARRVIIRTPYDFRGSLMDILTYNQMIGRAGRKGVDTIGESVIICPSDDRNKFFELRRSEPRPITSCLVKSGSQSPDPSNTTFMSPALKRAVLEIIANEIAKTYDDVYKYMNCTLFASGDNKNLTQETLKEVLKHLTENKLLHDIEEGSNTQKRTAPTNLGKAVLASAISPDDGLFILEELTKARKSMCLFNDLHLLYEVTPLSASEQVDIDWQHFYDIWNNLAPDLKDVGGLVGVKEYHLIEMIGGKSIKRNGYQLSILKRFYTALALFELIHETPLPDVADKFRLGKGFLQSLQQSASSFAGMITVFCNRLGWKNLETLFDQFQSRLYFGIQQELIDLMRITCLTSNAARHLFNRGYDTVAALTRASVTDIELQLMNSGPFQRDVKQHGENSRLVWSAGQCRAMNEKEMAQAIVNEARELVQKDLGIKIEWSNSSQSSETSSSQRKKLSQQSETSQPNNDSEMIIDEPNHLKSAADVSSIVDQEAQEWMEKDPEIDKCPDSQFNSKTPPEIVSFVNEDQTQSKFESQMSIELDEDKHSQQEDETFEEPPNKRSPKKFIPVNTLTSSPLNKNSLVRPNFDLSISTAGKLETTTATGEMDYSERTPSLESLESPDSPLPTITKFDQIKVGSYTKKIIVSCKGPLLETLMTNWMSNRCFAIQFDIDKKVSPSAIGANIKQLKIEKSSDESDDLEINLHNLVVKSLTVCFNGESNVYHVNSKEVLQEIRTRLPLILKSNPQIVTFDVKQTYQVFRNFFKIDQSYLFNEFAWFDPKVGHWIFDPESRKPKKIAELIKDTLYRTLQSYMYLISMRSDVVAEQCTSVCLLLPLMNELMQRLESAALFDTFKNVEISSRLVIAQMEINGIGLDKDYCERQADLLFEAKNQLAAKAFEIAKKRFKLSNPNEVASILYKDLNLLSYFCKEDGSLQTGTKLVKNRKSSKHLGTSKPVLKKLAALSGHPLPQIILDWRRVDHALKKTVQPLLSHCTFNKEMDMYRVHCICDDWTATGRIAIEDPNLIGINKDFVIKDVENPEEPSTSTNQEISFSLRKVIIARKGYNLVSADYSQLELRILAHLSGEKNLSKVLNEGGDVFKNIAALWKSKPIEDVTGEERQQAKHICYGMIYGIGAKSLSETLGVTEEEASEFMSSFMDRYSGIKKFIKKTVENCRESEGNFVQTLNGRIRFLKNIESNSSAERAHAERQAVNTTIQGSASDLVKSAMVLVHKNLLEQTDISVKLVLQMHDELMYEVAESDWRVFAELLRESMESCSQRLTVYLPVKVKFGKNWGEMNEVHEF